MPDPTYDAFISYRRSDGGKVAHWLRRELQGYRAPRMLRAQYGRRLKVYLDTAYERGTSDFYESSIRPALLASRFLLVIATPDARRRPAGVEDWMQREVADFSEGPHGRNVVAVRGAGEFDDPLPADLTERFPNIEIVDLGGAGRFWYLHPARAARLSSEKLKLVAPLLDIPPEEMPRLRQEEEKLQQARLGGTAGATAGVLVAVSALSIFALQSRYAATRALEDSMFATGSMVLLSAGLPQDADEATARPRRLLINQGCDLLDKLALGADSQPQIGEIVTCHFERARERERLKEHAEARRHYDAAIDAAARRYRQTPRSDAAIRLVQAREALARFLARQGDAAGGEAEYGRLVEDARRFDEAHTGREEFVRAQAAALGELGDLFSQRKEWTRAQETYTAGAAAVSRLVELEAARRAPIAETVGWLARLHRLAGEARQQLGDASGALEQYRLSAATSRRVEPGRLPPDLELEAAVTQARILDILLRGEDRAAATAAKADALACVGRVLGAEAVSADTLRRAEALKSWIEQRASAN